MRALWIDWSGRPHRDAAVRLGAADDRFGLHLGVVDLVGREGALDEDIRLGKGLVHIALDDLAGAGDVVLDLDFLVAVHHRLVERLRAGLQRLERVQDDRQRFVLHLDRPGGLLGQLFGLRGDRGHRLAHPADLVGQDVVVLVQRPLDGDDALVVAQLRDILEGQHHRAHGFRGAGIDRFDAGMGVRGADRAPVQHARQADVNGVLFLPGNPGDPVFARGYMPNNLKVFFLHSHSSGNMSILLVLCRDWPRVVRYDKSKTGKRNKSFSCYFLFQSYV